MRENPLALREDGNRGAVGPGRELDAVDQRIIEALQKNGRESFRRIASEIGVSEATVRARYSRLCSANILQVTGVTNPLGLGFDAQAMVGIRTTGAPEPVADQIAKWHEAGYVVVTAGQYDILVYYNDTIPFAGDMAADVARMKDAHVQFVMPCMDTNQVVKLQKEMLKQGLKAVQNLPNAYDHDFLAQNRKIFEGAFLEPYYYPPWESTPQSPETKQYLSRA